MFQVQDYYKTARENEAVFRNILRDMRDNREERPYGEYIPPDIETDAPLEQIFEKHSAGDRTAKFTISDFVRAAEDTAIITWENISSLSGAGAELIYFVRSDNSVEYDEPGITFRS